MPTVKGTQYYLDDSIRSESDIIEWLKTLESNKKRGSKSAATVRLLIAGLYLEKLNPSLVDLMVSESDKGNEPSFELLSKVYEVFSGVSLNKIDKVVAVEKKLADPNDGFSSLSQ